MASTKVRRLGMNWLRRTFRVREDDGESEEAKRCGKGMADEYDQDVYLSK